MIWKYELSFDDKATASKFKKELMDIDPNLITHTSAPNKVEQIKVKVSLEKISNLRFDDKVAVDRKVKQVYDKYRTRNIGESVNLKENYIRLFGKMPEENRNGQRIKDADPITLTETEMNRWVNLQRKFNAQYPKRNLQLKHGKVYVDTLLVEDAKRFLSLDNNGMIQKLKSSVQKLNG